MVDKVRLQRLSPKTNGTKYKRYTKRGARYYRRGSMSETSIPIVPSNSQASMSPAAIKGWTFLLESGREFDQQRLENWRDELNNLLVFAGLFSAVTTAFVVESYQSLQPDSASVTNQLLSQISVQLSSFTLAPGFANATSSTPSTSPVPNRFKPAATDIDINLLWFLSLTLSLVASFLTIAAQQWLRSLSLPRQLSVSNAVRLQQCHRRDMSFCQVPNIIALLPVLLQIAVILFLVGLYFFLNDLNERITISYSIIALLPFVLYAVSLFLPLFWPECPFKSPLVPSVAFVLQWAVFLLFVLAMVLVIFPSLLLARLGTAILVFCGKAAPCNMGTHQQHVRWRLFVAASRFQLHLRKMYALLFKQMGDFWSDLELKHLQSSEKANQDVVARDFADALTAAPSFVPRVKLKRLRECYRSLPPAQRTRCALEWAAMHLGYSGEEDISESGNWSRIDEKFVTKVKEYLSIDLNKLLLQSLPESLTEKDWVTEVPNITRVLILLNQLVILGDVNLRDKLVPMLLDICGTQKIEVKGFWANDRIRGMSLPTVCLFQCSIRPTSGTGGSEFQFNSAETRRLLELATRRSTELLGQARLFEIEYATVNFHDIVLGSYAVALLALSQHSKADWDDELTNADMNTVRETLEAFQQYIDAKGHGIRFTGQVARTDANKRLIITPQAMGSIAKSLHNLCAQPAIHSQCKALVRSLVEVCHDEPAFRDIIFEEADGTPRTVQPPRRKGLSEMLFQTRSSRGSVSGLGEATAHKEELEMSETRKSHDDEQEARGSDT